MKLFLNGLVIFQPLFECQMCARQCDATVKNIFLENSRIFIFKQLLKVVE